MVNASKHYALDFPTVIKVALIALFALSLVILTEGLCDECREDDQVCCSGDCFHGSSCLGLYCSSDLNCSRGQSCCSNACVNEPNCGLSQNCSTDLDCSYNESCCSEKCESGDRCVGLSCSTDSNCGSESCCRGKCASSCSGVDYITVILLLVQFGLPGIFGLLILYSFLFLFYHKLADCLCKHRHDQEEEDQRGIPAESNSFRPCEAPPSNEQVEPWDPPPSYEQIEPSVPPPSYDEVQEGRTGGEVFVFQNTH